MTDKIDSEEFRPASARVIGINVDDGAKDAALLVEIDGEKIALRLDFVGLRSTLEYVSPAMFKVGTSPENGIPHLPVQRVAAHRFEGADRVSVQVHFGTLGFLHLSLSDTQSLELAAQLQRHANPSAKSSPSH